MMSDEDTIKILKYSEIITNPVNLMMDELEKYFPTISSKEYDNGWDEEKCNLRKRMYFVLYLELLNSKLIDNENVLSLVMRETIQIKDVKITPLKFEMAGK